MAEAADHNPEKQRGANMHFTKGHLVLSLAITLVFLVLPAAVPAEDLDITISKGAIERLFTAVQPITFEADLVAGQKATVSLTNPKISLQPGTPGKIWVELDYDAKTALLGLGSISGKVKPEVRFAFDPEKGAMRITLHSLNIKGIPLDSMVEPNYLPLTSTDPIELQDKQIQVKAEAAKTEITKTGLRVLMNYKFIKTPAKQ